MHFHSQNLTDGRLPMWREGGCWWGPWHAEWQVFRRPSFSLAFRQGSGDGNERQIHIALILFSLWLTYEFRPGPGWRHLKERELSVDWHHGCLWLKLWADDDWSRGRPWHRNTICFHVFEWFTGSPKCHTEQGDYVDCLVPMPEGCYRARARPETRTWTWRFGFNKVRKSWSIEIPEGIPFQGKGENSWDCGDDGLYGTGGDSLEDAIGNAVASVLENRRRYGETSETRGRVVLARPTSGAGA